MHILQRVWEQIQREKKKSPQLFFYDHPHRGLSWLNVKGPYILLCGEWGWNEVEEKSADCPNQMY